VSRLSPTGLKNLDARKGLQPHPFFPNKPGSLEQQKPLAFRTFTPAASHQHLHVERGEGLVSASIRHNHFQYGNACPRLAASCDHLAQRLSSGFVIHSVQDGRQKEDIAISARCRHTFQNITSSEL